MPVTPMLELYAHNSNPRLPVTGWMQLPEIQSIDVQAIYASEVNDTAATPDVGVKAYAQFSADGGFSVASGSDVAIHSSFVNLRNNQWNLHQAKLDLDSYMNGYTHVRVALECKTNFSGTSQGDGRIAPFSASVQYAVINRRVQRIPIERRVIAQISSTPAAVRLTAGVVPEMKDTFKCRAVCTIEAGIGTTFTVRPVWLYSDHPENAAVVSWATGGDIGTASWTTALIRTVSDVQTLTGFNHAGLAFGAKVWSGASSSEVAGTLSGFFEVF